MKVAPAVTFEVDKVFEQAARVEQILREIEPKAGPAADDHGTDDPSDKE